MRTTLLILFLITASFQACDGSLGRPNSPGNGQGYEGEKPDGSGQILNPPASGAVAAEFFVYQGSCTDRAQSESVIQYSKNGFELVADNCANLNSALVLDDTKLTLLQGPPVTLIYNGRLYLKVLL